MTTPQEARAIAQWLRADFEGNAIEEAADMLTEYADMLERQVLDIHSCHPNCTRSGCVNERLRGQLGDARAQIRRQAALMASAPNVNVTGRRPP